MPVYRTVLKVPTHSIRALTPVVYIDSVPI